MMERLSALLEKKGSLDIQDACFILQFLQDHTGPLLSLRTPSPSIPSGVKSRCCKQSSPGDLVMSKKHSLKDERETKKSADLNIASLVEFPPVAVLIQEKR